MNTGNFQRFLTAMTPSLTSPLGLGIAGAGLVGTGLLAKGAIDAVGKQKQLEGKTLLGQSPAGDLDTIEAIKELQRSGAMLTPEIAQALVKPTNELENARLQRALQQNQQLGQITGALARQKYGFQLAGGAQQLGGNVLNTMMANPNPYANSAMGNMVNLSL